MWPLTNETATLPPLPVVLFYTVQGVWNFWACERNPEAIEQYFPVVLFIMLYKAIQTLDVVDETDPKVWPFKLKAIGPRLCWRNCCMLILLYKVVLTLESVHEILKCDHSNESYWAVLFCGAVSVILYKVVSKICNYESVDEILKCDHSD